MRRLRETRGGPIAHRAGRAALLSLLMLTAGCNQLFTDPTGLLSKQAQDVAWQQMLPALVEQGGVLAFRIETSHAKVSHDPEQTAVVERVRDRILEAVRQTEYADAAKGMDWQVVVLKDDGIVDAAAFPGGKIIVWTGLLQRPAKGRLTVPVEQRLAVILGHEVVHVLAHHFAQRVDKELHAAFDLSMTGKTMTEQGMDPATTAALMAAMGIAYEGAAVRPFTGEQELDADRVGLLLTARAGYDPQNAVEFWKQIDALSGGKHALELLAMHPSYDTRISQLTEWMPEARAQFSAARAGQAQVAKAK